MGSPAGMGAKGPFLLAAFVAVLLAVAVDLALMHSRYHGQRLLLEDVRHFPTFHWVYDPANPEFNRDGLRESRGAAAFEAPGCNILFLGDSFVFGMRVQPQQALPQQLERVAAAERPGEKLRVANFGWVSASPYLQKDLLAELGPSYRPDVVLLAVDVTDPHEDIKYRHYSERKGVHALLDWLPSWLLLAKEFAADRGLHEEWFGYPGDRLFPVNRSLEESRPHMQQTRAHIEAIAAIARDDLGARFGLLVLPRHYHYSDRESPEDWETGAYDRAGEHRFEWFRYFDEMRSEVEFPVRSLLPALRPPPFFPTTFHDDPHWTPATHRYMAGKVFEILEEEGLLCEPGAG